MGLINLSGLRQFGVEEILPIKRAVSSNTTSIGALNTTVNDLVQHGVIVYADNGVVKFGRESDGGGE